MRTVQVCPRDIVRCLPPCSSLNEPYLGKRAQSTRESVRQKVKWETKMKENPELWKRHEERCRRRFEQVQKHGLAGQGPALKRTKGTGAMEHAETRVSQGASIMWPRNRWTNRKEG